MRWIGRLLEATADAARVALPDCGPPRPSVVWVGGDNVTHVLSATAARAELPHDGRSALTHGGFALVHRRQQAGAHS